LIERQGCEQQLMHQSVVRTIDKMCGDYREKSVNAGIFREMSAA
jgi:hypothetical protein